jgi:dihydroneopterin aldolase
MKSHLQIRGLTLPINLGWRDKEREHEQLVLLDFELKFKDLPKACTTDQLKDTVCYATLIKTLREELNDGSFRLVEHLAYEIHRILKSQLPKDISLTVHITKHPKIKGLTGGVCFSCYDDDAR